MAESFSDWLRSRNSGTFFGVQPAQSDTQQTVYGKGPSNLSNSTSAPATQAASVTPNYSEILSSPEVQFANQEALAGGNMDASARAAAIRRAVIELGQVPDFAKAGRDLGMDSLGYLAGDINDETRALAQKNTDEGLSLMARLQHEHERVQRQVQDTLAARGIFRSGETGYQMGEQGLKYKQALTDAEKSVMDHINEIIGTFVTNERDRRNMVAQAIFSSMNRAGQSQPAAGGGGGRQQAAPAPAPAPDLNRDPFANGYVDVGPDPLPWWAQTKGF